MATLTTDQLSDLQADLGITDDESVFADAELNRLFTRAEEDYDLTVIYALRQMWRNAAKFTKYTQNASSEERQQIFDHLGKLLADAEGKYGLNDNVLEVGTIALGIDATCDNLNQWDS
jgi:hypothetical protein